MTLLNSIDTTRKGSSLYVCLARLPHVVSSVIRIGERAIIKSTLFTVLGRGTFLKPPEHSFPLPRPESYIGYSLISRRSSWDGGPLQAGGRATDGPGDCFDK